MNENPRSTWLPFALFAAVLLVWAGMFAFGAYLEWGADQPHRDVRKPIIILATMGVFLSLWGLALWLKGRRG